MVEDVWVLRDAELRRVADRLVEVPGVAAVMLGGSRARGAEQLDSDVDLGLYYRQPLDVEGLQLLAETLAEARSGPERPTVTRPGEWGPWVDGGGWLRIDGTAVDWIYRDLDRVQKSSTSAQEGSFSFHFQVGHPLGVPDFAYAGEVALGVVLADPSGELAELKDRLATYPPTLAQGVVGQLGEAYFLLGAWKSRRSEQMWSWSRARCSASSGFAPTPSTRRPDGGSSARRGSSKLLAGYRHPRLDSSCAPTRFWEASVPTPQVCKPH